ncbi:receptor-transporting protein 2 [Pelodiscus sinensis]|uniref:receptor-transporting protein 2 n=1 Tax=Pelodiscus sinensis TaxID=13735 RepID=UPI003F6D2A4A
MQTLTMDSWREMFYEKIDEVKPQDKWDLTMHQDLDYNVLEPGWVQSVQEHAFASFQCSRCHHSWSSAQVVVLFHMYLDPHRRKSRVKMRVFRQECYECSEGNLEKPHFQEESVRRILAHLVSSIREKCYGEFVDHSQLAEVTVSGWPHGPHRSDHCEACRLGIHQTPTHSKHHRKPKGTVHHGTSKDTMPLSQLPSNNLLEGPNCCSEFCCVLCVIFMFIFIYLMTSQSSFRF